MMRYWNSREMIDRILEIIGMDAGSMPEQFMDIVIDFCTDLVGLHNFQIERAGSDPNAQVAELIARYTSQIVNFTIFTLAETQEPRRY